MSAFRAISMAAPAREVVGFQSGYASGPDSVPCGLDFQSFSFLAGVGVENGHEKDADEKAREEATDDDQGERALGVGTDPGRDGSRQESKGGDQGGHHDRPEPLKGGLTGCR